MTRPAGSCWSPRWSGLPSLLQPGPYSPPSPLLPPPSADSSLPQFPSTPRHPGPPRSPFPSHPSKQTPWRPIRLPQPRPTPRPGCPQSPHGPGPRSQETPQRVHPPTHPPCWMQTRCGAPLLSPAGPSVPRLPCKLGCPPNASRWPPNTHPPHSPRLQTLRSPQTASQPEVPHTL